MVQIQTNKPHWHVTEKIIGAAFEVHRNLGHGFLERVYVGALIQELTSLGLRAQTERAIPVSYKGVQIGVYFADIIVGFCDLRDQGDEVTPPRTPGQLLNYLRATGIEVGLLLNFGVRVQHKRMILNPSKPS